MLKKKTNPNNYDFYFFVFQESEELIQHYPWPLQWDFVDDNDEKGKDNVCVDSDNNDNASTDETRNDTNSAMKIFEMEFLSSRVVVGKCVYCDNLILKIIKRDKC